MYGGNEKGNAWALIPLIIFVGMFLGVGISTGDFTTMPLNVAILVASIVGLVLNRKESFHKKLKFLQRCRTFQYYFNDANFLISRCLFSNDRRYGWRAVDG